MKHGIRRWSVVLACCCVRTTAQELNLHIFPEPAQGNATQPEYRYGDLDGDGLPDRAKGGSGNVEISHGIGNGLFDATHALPGPAVDLAPLIDCNGDGQLDVVGVLSSQVSIMVFAHAGSGDGTFGPFVWSLLQVAGIDFPADGPSAADIDGDGRQDIVGSWDDPDALLWVAAGNGDGTFALASTIPLAGFDHPLVIADFNVDGRLDAATLDESIGVGTVNVHVGLPDGTLSRQPISSAWPEANMVGFTHMAAGDFDADGVSDLGLTGLFFQNPVTGFAALLHGSGGGTFVETGNQILSGTGRCAARDLDEDGRDDLVVTHTDFYPPLADNAGISIVLASPSGGLAPEQRVMAWKAPSTPAIVDIDRDGSLDLGLGASVVFGYGDGTFEDVRRVKTHGNPLSVELADFNADGKPDLLGAIDGGAPTLAVALGAGGGVFAQAVDVELGDTVAGEAVGELNGDGLPDLVLDGVTLSSPGPLTVRLNLGSGMAWSPPLTLEADDAARPVLADLDGDGALDVAAVKPVAQRVVVHPGDGHGAFFAPKESSIDLPTTGLTLVDLDLDGALDALLGNKTKKELLVMPGSGDGQFAAPAPIAAAVKPIAFTAGDLNEDGWPDCAANGVDPMTTHVVVAVLVADAPGTFSTPVKYEASVAGTLKIEDIDRDSHADILLTSGFPGDVGVLRGVGNGLLSAQRSFGAGEDSRGLALADLDADGFKDAAVAGHDASGFKLLRNVASFFPDLGFQHGTAIPLPHLHVEGMPLPGSKVTFAVTNVAPAAAGLFFAGLDFAPVPFHGGTLAPSPGLVLAMSSGMPLGGRWPIVPAGTAIYAQAWFATGGEFVATNAVVGFTQ